MSICYRANNAKEWNFIMDRFEEDGFRWKTGERPTETKYNWHNPFVIATIRTQTIEQLDIVNTKDRRFAIWVSRLMESEQPMKLIRRN